MSIYRNKIILWAFILLIASLLVSPVLINIWSKNELCRTYYADMSRLACIWSNVGLPGK